MDDARWWVLVIVEERASSFHFRTRVGELVE